MARKTGQFNYPYNYEVKLTAPLDSRALVDTVDSLINSTTWTDSDGGIYIYNGLLVSVTENNSVYMLTDADNYTNIESWKKINDDTVVLDYTVNVTYSELIELRKNNQLVPGQLYRITDYVTTTAQENTKSAEHQFDIVVRAITENTLSENAKVCAINKNDKEPESVTVVNTELAHTGWSNVEVDAIPDGIKDILNFTPSANTDIKCYTTTVVCGKGDLNSNFKFKSGNKKINCVGVDIVKNNEVINFDYHTGYTGNAHKFNDYTLTIPEYGEYEIRFFINHREEGVDATSILTCVNIAVFDYFDNNDLNAWEIKYCLDNDTSRFAWADPDNGKGVIYYMKDEYGNEAPYDFKNIMYIKDGEEIPTFGDNCSNNIIKEYKVKNKFNLPNITFGKDCHDNTFGKDCHDNTFENNCNTNTFGKDCHDNTFGKDCHDNTFENNCNTNTFESGCTYNTFGHDCDYNAFESICFNNTFGSSCVNNAFESGCSSNTFGFNCINNTFGDNCKNNTFERFCNNNTFGSKCSTNTFGENCDYNAFESGCTDNTFGSDCTGNTLNELFQGNIVGISFCNNKIGAKYSFNKFGNNCHNLHIIEKQTSGIDSPLQNFNFGAGLTGEIELKGKNIRNRLFETKVCYNSNGDIVQYCEADLVMVNPYEEENNIVTATTTEDSIELTGNIEVGEDEITITGDNIKIINVDNNNNYEIIIE